MQSIGCLGAAKITPISICKPALVVAGAQLCTIGARQAARASEFAKRYGFESASGSYSEVIASDEVSLVYNALPINHHHEWTVRALNAGKHVLCEKPFAMNKMQARDMIATAKASGRRVIEAFHYRYHPAFVEMLAWINSGHIGDIKRLTAYFTAPIDNQDGTEIRHRVKTGGGAFMDLGCYPLHWVRTVLNSEPIEVGASAQVTPAGVDEDLSATLVFHGGIEATLYASMAIEKPRKNQLRIEGTKGRITFNNPLAPHTGAELYSEGTSSPRRAAISPISTYTYQLAAVIQALAADLPLPTEGQDTLNQQTALDKIYDTAGLQHLRQLA